MAVSICSCFFNVSSRSPVANQLLPPSIRPKREIGWRNQCVVGMACVIIGLQAEGLIGNNHIDQAIAADPVAVVVQSEGKVKRWSEKRKCPAWQLNSLETIVPENLPRPSFKRRSEAVRHLSKVAPPLKHSSAAAAGGGCFSL